jgi:hypothetical protein
MWQWLIALAFVVASIVPALAQDAAPTRIFKNYLVTGVDRTGKKASTTVTFGTPLRDTLPPKAGQAPWTPMAQYEEDVNFYKGYYKPAFDTASYKMDCVGYVMKTLGLVEDETFVDAVYFKENILDRFAEVRTGPPQAGDILYFELDGRPKHVAVVTANSSRKGSATISSKDNNGSVVDGTMKYELGVQDYKDPIQNLNGGVKAVYYFKEKPVFRVGTKLTVEAVDTTKNDRPVSKASVTLKLLNGKDAGEAETDDKGEAVFVLVDDPPGQLQEVRKGLQVRGKKKDGPVLLARSDSIDGDLLKGEEPRYLLNLRKEFDLTGQWEDQAGSVYSFDQAEDKDGQHVKGRLRGSARSGHADLNGALEGWLVGAEFTGDFTNWERKVRSEGKVYFKVSDDGQSFEGRMTGKLRWPPNNVRDISYPLKFTFKK